MQFIAVKTALQNLLGTEGVGVYQVIGFQRQEKSGEEFIGNNQSVEVYYKKSDFPKNRSGFIGTVSNEVEYNIELTVSAMAKADLAVLENPASTPVQLEAALLAAKEASNEADDKIDILISLVWNTLMSALNKDLGLPVGTVTDRWVGSASKGDPNARGQLVVLTAILPYNCTLCEEPPGELPLDIVEINLENEINEDTNQKTGFIQN